MGEEQDNVVESESQNEEPVAKRATREDLFGVSDDEEEVEEDVDPAAGDEDVDVEDKGEARASLRNAEDAVEGEEAEGSQAEEASPSDEERREAGDEFESMFKQKKKKKEGRTAEVVMAVDALLANMEVAAEMDIVANESGKPAIHKVKMLGVVDESVSQTNLQRELLDGGILGAMKLWVEPLPDGSLPNVKEQLKRSQLGRYVMFYSRLEDETLSNKKLARSLIEHWSRPIYESLREPYDAETQEREAELDAIRKRRRLESDRVAAAAAAKAAAAPAKKLKPGDDGFRWHATIPHKASLDYTHRPMDRVNANDVEVVKGRAKPKDRLSKKLASMSRRKLAANVGGRVSLQGKGMTL